jgi:phosphoribosyl 1,2-cyclic phosphodiesterase
MKIEFYGVRGSYPVPGNDTIKYGGNTTCVSISKEVNGKIIRLIFDSGTGIIRLGKDIIKNYFEGKETLCVNLFFTHLHPDHCQGFPFFAVNFFKNSCLKLYGMQTLHKHIGDILSEQMYPPNFPIEYRDLKSDRESIVLVDGQTITISDFTVTCMQAFAPSHPQQGAMYYKVRDNYANTEVVCVWDNESKIGGDQAVIRFAKDCNVMIHDTHYTSEEYVSNKIIVQGFGHSTYDMAMNNAIQAHIKQKLICLHFNPLHDDYKLDLIQKQINDNCRPFETVLAKEGLILII